MFDIFVEDSLHSQGKVLVVDESVSFEVVLKRAEVDIRRPTGAQLIVGNKELRVVKLPVVEIHAVCIANIIASVGMKYGVSI